MNVRICGVDYPACERIRDGEYGGIKTLENMLAATKSVITATHDLGDIEDIADRCYVLDAGQLVADRIPSEVLRDTDLLRRTNLVHAHRHRHPTGEIHSHPHLHRSED